MSNEAPQKTKEEMIRAFRTSEILAAARRVIGQEGYDEASMEKIAQEAGVAKGTLYLYFENKETLLARAYESGHSEIMAEIISHVDQAETFTGKLKTIIRLVMELNASQHGFFSALIGRPELGRFGGTVASEQIRTQINDFVGFVSRLLEAGIQEKEFRPMDTLIVGRFISEVVCSALVEKIHQPEAIDLDKEIEELITFVLRGIQA